MPLKTSLQVFNYQLYTFIIIIFLISINFILYIIPFKIKESCRSILLLLLLLPLLFII